MPYLFNPFTGSFDDTIPLSGGKISSEYLPSYVDDIIEVADFAALPGTGETGKIYITLNDNNTYRWSGSQYVLVGPEPPVASVNGVTGAVTLGLNSLEDTNLNIDPPAGASLIWNGAEWVKGPSIGGVQTYTAANLIIPFNNTVNPTQGSLYDSGVTTAISSSITFSTTTKKIGSGSAFFNNAGGVAINNSTLFNFFRQNSWTLEVWLYPVTLNTNWIFGFVNNNGSSNNIQLKVTNTRQLSVLSGSSTIISASANTAMNQNDWNHVALVYNYSTNQITMYLNGISKGTGTTGTWNTSHPIFSIGSLYSATYNNWFNRWGIGYMDNIVLTPGLKYTGTFTPSTSEEGAFLPERYVPSDVTGITGASTITNMVQLSQANYDAIVTPDANTLYVIV